MLHLDIKKRLPMISIDVQFVVNNEIVILFGPSGAGKTTILNCIAGLTHPDSGTIMLNGSALYGNDQKPTPVQNRHIGYLFQDYALFPHMTIEKNINYGRKDSRLVDQLVNVMGIEPILSHYPKQISGGEKQRVALARALATQPSVLLLDEPFSALDEATREQCHQELLRLYQIWEIPIVLVTHDYQEAVKLGDRILEIKDGKMNSTGW
ncbi:ATP-binding cassette domain-containing protein [Thalassobacillus sp. CUG 92003]|uniref:ATP-binding cassette domain-containing protein n=1 Tax=Thalassobacillus sp. CUG 92003 TaxID=2736641 RepID=UPI0015E710F0|nr:ATP-binding cassette domain-containing protein [Thalassobacillus sp. CUG 92003]